MALLAAGFAPVTIVQLPNFKPQRSKPFIISAGPKRSTIGGGKGGQINSISSLEERKVVVSNSEATKNNKQSNAKKEVNEDIAKNSD